ncbi:MAG: NAD-dependent epimerase/dehydratase family protein [Candidatus Moranbacteria bacterium]|nr:NAD-dependent epimerase/dehydratase family protein [Candidatus Moranbacteria bacterium]
MKILITGGAGFIGSHLVDALINKGHQIIVFDNLSTGKKENLNPKASFKKIDLKNLSKVKKLVLKEKFEIIFHLAAQINSRKSVFNPINDAQDILNALNLIESAKTLKEQGILKKFIFASTGVVYGDHVQRPTSETEKEWPLCPYGIEKLTIDKYLNYYHRIFNLNFISFRLANVFGPRQNPQSEAGVISIFLEKMLKNQQPTIYGDGTQTRDYIYIEDIISANLLALENLDKTGIYNLGTGFETSVNKLFDHLNVFFNQEYEKKHAPAQLGEGKKIALTAEKFKQEFNWKPKINFEAGLTKTFNWFKNKS